MNECLSALIFLVGTGCSIRMQRWLTTTPLVSMASAPMCVAFGIMRARDGDIAWAGIDATCAAIHAREVWSWWRRRRQGRPSRAVGIIRDLGHRLVVAPASPQEAS